MHLISVCLRCVGLLHPVTWSKSKPVSPDSGNDPGKKGGSAQARERQADILIGYKRANRWRLNEGCQVFSSKNEECYVFMRILFWGDLNWIIVIIDLCTLQDMVRAMVGVYVGMMIVFLCLFKVRRSKTQKLRAKRRAKPAGAAIVLCQCLSIFMWFTPNLCPLSHACRWNTCPCHSTAHDRIEMAWLHTHGPILYRVVTRWCGVARWVYPCKEKKNGWRLTTGPSNNTVLLKTLWCMCHFLANPAAFLG